MQAQVCHLRALRALSVFVVFFHSGLPLRAQARQLDRGERPPIGSSRIGALGEAQAQEPGPRPQQKTLDDAFTEVARKAPAFGGMYLTDKILNIYLLDAKPEVLAAARTAIVFGPGAVRGVEWPGKFQAGTVLDGIVSHQDWLPTLLAAAGEPDIKDKLLKGHRVGAKTYKVYIDGFNLLPYLMGEVKESPRQSMFYISDDGDIRRFEWATGRWC